MKNRLWLLTIFTWIISGCDKTNDLGLQDSDYAETKTYKAQPSAEFDEKNRLQLSWDTVAGGNDKVTFELYEHILNPNEQPSGELISSGDAQKKSFRSIELYKITTNTEITGPSKRGSLKATLASQSEGFLLDERLILDKTYAYEIVAKLNGESINAERYVLVVKKIDYDNLFSGCGTVKAQQTTASVSFEFPQQASDVSVYRNGIKVFNTLSDKNTSFVDKGLSEGSQYTYNCSAKIGPVEVFSDPSAVVTEGSDGNIPVAPVITKIYKIMNRAVSGYIDEISLSDEVTTDNPLDQEKPSDKPITAKAEEEEGPNPLDDVTDYKGCLAAAALDTSRIKIDFEFPAVAEYAKVFRNGILVFSAEDEIFTSFTDSGLNEGDSYLYTCKIYNKTKGLLGSQYFQVSTKTANPPAFTGIRKAEFVNNKVKLSWLLPSSLGVIAKEYQIFMQPLSSVSDSTPINWYAPVKTIPEDSLSQTTLNVSEFGDATYYRFGVRSCSIANQCDDNEVSQVLFVPDTGAPSQPTITAGIVNGKIEVNAPWSHEDGEVKKRKAYWSKDGGSVSLAQTFLVSDPLNPIETLRINTPLIEGSTYQLYLVDEDSQGSLSSNSNAVSISVIDISAPTFTGLTDVVPSAPADSTVELQFTTPASGEGVTQYLVYALELASNASGNACSVGSLIKTIDASGFAASTAVAFDLSGLQGRTRYSLCLRAKDSSGNISTNSSANEIVTQDITAPLFGGLGTVQFENQQKDIILTWPISESTDIKEFKVEIWSGTQGNYGSATQILVPYSNNTKAGATITNTQYPVSENTVYWVLVNACDNAAPDYGTQNCSAYVAAHSYSFVTNDLTPPAGFGGVTTISQASEGSLTVNWNAPASWTDYRGFKIYDLVDNALVLLKTCACSAVDCPNNVISCLLDVDPYRNYNFYVTAYDAAGNQAYNTPYANNSVAHTSLDTTKPTFVSSLTIGAAPLYPVSWTAASDNQTNAGSQINYMIYRKKNADFIDITNPGAEIASANVIAIPALTALSVNDYNTKVEGATYYYTACATDESSNEKCLGFSESLYVTDITPPVLSYFQSTKEVGIPNWTMRWGGADNYTTLSNLQFKVYRTVTNAAADPATEVINLVSASTGQTLNCVGYCELTGQTGPQGQTKYINYKLVATDEAGNTVESSTVSVLTDGSVFEVTSVVRQSGPVSGGTLAIVNGTGFQNGATVSMGDIPCDRTDYISTTQLLCLTGAAGTAGVKVVVVTNPGGGTNPVPVVTFEYMDTGEVCNQPGLRAKTLAQGFAGGTGVSSDPYLICTLAQLQEVYTDLSSHYLLKDNIDMYALADWEPYTIGQGAGAIFVGSFKGEVNVDGTPKYVIAHMKSNAVGNDNGLFGKTNGSVIENLMFFNSLLNLGISNWDYHGTLIGYADNTQINNIVVEQGAINNGRQYIGGIVGYIRGSSNIDDAHFRNGAISALASGSYAGGSSIGGIVGYLDNIIVAGMEIKNSTSSGILSAINYLGGILGHSSMSDGELGLLSFSSSAMDIQGNDYIGGIAGKNEYYNALSISFSGNVTGRSYVGGLIGQFSQYHSRTMFVKSSYVDGSVTGRSSGLNVGGLVGHSVRTYSWSYPTLIIEECASLGIITSSGTRVGGLVGAANYSIIRNSYFDGVLSGSDIVGGLIGNISTSTFIRSNYVTGSFSALLSTAGGICGMTEGSSRSIENTFWNTTSTSGADYCTGGATVETYTDSGARTIAVLTDPTMAEYSSGSYPWSNTVWNIDGTNLPSLKSVTLPAN